MEQIYFEDKIGETDVLLSDKRFKIGTKTFVAEQVTTVDLKKQVTRKNVLFYYLLVFLGSFLAMRESLFTYAIPESLRITGFVIATVCILAIWLLGRKQIDYTVRVGSSSGVVDVYMTRNARSAMQLLEEMNLVVSNREQEQG
ncbi:hypothetical protein EV586_103101 [Tumebacillus sp. BK434]|uniref:DUF6232 family protein n=1 Tax=Tumebacillus sp. BK434 TaxID=2512169 RepID=UPI00104F518A|nr:DUF6232 family protein [Tumebacillus sp. BK434]TCP55449.1 hypothetical protein EV586_103101 [Tumebacillus sp. BK434]